MREGNNRAYFTILLFVGLAVGTSMAYLKCILDSSVLEKSERVFIAKLGRFKESKDLFLRNFFLTADKLYLLDSGRIEEKLAELYYDAYLLKWADIMREKRVEFGTISITGKAYTLLALSYLCAKKNRSAMYEFMEGFNRINRGVFDPATQNLERVFHAEIPHLDRIALLYYGYCKQQTKDYHNALEKYHRLENISGDSIPQLFYNLAVIYEKEGKLEKALMYRQKFDKTRP